VEVQVLSPAQLTFIQICDNVASDEVDLHTSFVSLTAHSAGVKMFLIITILTLVSLWSVVGIVVRQLARLKKIWRFIPANTTAYKVSEKNRAVKPTDPTMSTPASGGGVIQILHNIPGHQISHASSNCLQWEVVPGKGKRGLMYRLYGVEYVGVFSDLRENSVREFRKNITTKTVEVMDGEEKKTITIPHYSVIVKENVSEFVQYSREHTVVIERMEALEGDAIMVMVTVKYHEPFPLRARLEVADPNAVLSGLITQAMSGLIGEFHSDYYLYGPPERKRKLMRRVRKIVTKQALRAIGICITDVILEAIDVEESRRILYELNRTKQLEGQAHVTEAEKNALVNTIIAQNESENQITRAIASSMAKMELNNADADRVSRVEVPRLMATPGSQFAKAWAENKTATSPTLIFGGDASSKLLDSGVIVETK
jgi:regulator of protease activity HflC (stomatin/prohibitin superfamily)